MKWAPLAILAVITIVLQTTLLQAVSINGIRPDLMFVLSTHYALSGAWPEAAIAAWLLGLLTDLQTSPPNQIGLHAFLFGGSAAIILRLRQAVFREHFITQLVVTFIFALAVQLVAQTYFLWRGNAHSSTGLWPTITLSLGAATYTAVCAPLIHSLLLKIRNWTGLAKRRDR